MIFVIIFITNRSNGLKVMAQWDTLWDYMVRSYIINCIIQIIIFIIYRSDALKVMAQWNTLWDYMVRLYIISLQLELLEYPIPPAAAPSVTKSVTWRYLGNQVWYHRSDSVKTVRKILKIKRERKKSNKTVKHRKSAKLP